MRIINYILILLMIIMIGLTPARVLSQQTAANLNNSNTSNLSEQKPQTGQEDKFKLGFSSKTLMILIYYCEEIAYPLSITFFLGILFLCQQWFIIYREGKDARKIPVDKIKTMSFDDITQMITQGKGEQVIAIEEETNEIEKIPLLKKILGRRKKASAYQLLYKLYKNFESLKNIDMFNAEISSFVQHLKDIFNPFKTRMDFLSDTAGALGLLGTVWGMFLVFFQGTPDQSEVLRGMGIALATTIVGLVISIILNTFTTVISNVYDKHLEFINKMATIFQERMMTEAQKYPSQAASVVIDSSALIDKIQLQPIVPVEEKIAKSELEEQKPALPTVIPEKYGPPAEIRVIKGDNQVGEVNNLLPEPFIVEILDRSGNLLENETVIFTAEEGAGTFSNHSRIHKILTDDEGRAQTQLLLGKTTGEKTIHISVDGAVDRGARLLVIAKPTPPTKLVELKGNYQTGQLGKRLLDPLTVAIRDKYDNPIPRYEVSFYLKKGSGKFQDSQNSEFTATTNEDGLVEVYFIMGNERGAREIEAEAKKVEPSKIQFELFAV